MQTSVTFNCLNTSQIFIKPVGVTSLNIVAIGGGGGGGGGGNASHGGSAGIVNTTFNGLTDGSYNITILVGGFGYGGAFNSDNGGGGGGMTEVISTVDSISIISGGGGGGGEDINSLNGGDGCYNNTGFGGQGYGLNGGGGGNAGVGGAAGIDGTPGKTYSMGGNGGSGAIRETYDGGGQGGGGGKGGYNKGGDGGGGGEEYGYDGGGGGGAGYGGGGGGSWSAPEYAIGGGGGAGGSYSNNNNIINYFTANSAYNSAGIGGTPYNNGINGLVIITYTALLTSPIICIPKCPPKPLKKPGIAFGGTENIVGFEATQAFRYKTLVSLPFTSRASGTTRIINTPLNSNGYLCGPPPPRNKFG
jgi:hypothetical protein